MEKFQKNTTPPKLFHIFLVILCCYFPQSVSSTHAHSNPNSFMGIGHINQHYEDSLFDDEFPSSNNNNLGGGVHNNNNNGNSMCLPNYEISEGSIIRTKDSVELGGRFLNESDLGVNGREECLRLCCRTAYCNVAVFQEKSSGSCYMFDCGSTDDFRCKFTSQIQYMSAILRRKEIIQMSSNSNQQNVQQQTHSSSSNGQGVNSNNGNNQHETELSQLRSRGEELEKAKILSNNGSPRNDAIVAPTTSASSSLGPLDTTSHRCSRWEFECKSSKSPSKLGECIAIYDVCDGIPNCADSSDEGPELHCPSSVLGVAPPPNHPHPPISQQQQQSAVPPGSSSSFNHKDGGVMDHESYGNQLQQQKHLNPFLKPGYDYVNNGEQLPNSAYGGGGQNYLPNSQMSPGGNTYGGGYNNYPPYNSAGYPNQSPSLVMNLPQFNGQQQPQNNMNNLPFQVPPILQQQQPYFGGGPLNKGQQQQQQPLQNPLLFPPPINLPPMSNPANSAVLDKKPGEIESGNLQQPQSQTTTVPRLDSQPKSASSAANQNANSKEKSSTSNNAVTIPAGGSALEAESRLEDEILKGLKNQPYNEAETAAVHLDSEDLSPHKAGPGAVFLFMVGLVMTVILAVVVGCRLRRLGVGARRRRKNRLDPDYLVDGMYL